MARSTGSRGRGERARVAQSDLREVVKAVAAVTNLNKAVAPAQSDVNEAKRRRNVSKEKVKKLKKELEVADTKAVEAKKNLIEAKLEVAVEKAAQAKTKLTEARNYLLDLESVIEADEDGLAELGEKLKEHRLLAVNNVKDIEALEYISFDKKVRVYGKGKDKKRLIREATERGLRVEEYVGVELM